MGRTPVLLLTERAAKDPALTGGKGAALARLVAAGLPVPEGFVVTSEAFAQSAALLPQIEELLAGVDEANLQALQQACAEAAERIVAHRPPAEIVDAVREAYERLGSESVAVRSSATAEDMPEASFAGQYDSFLNVRGAKALIERMLHVWASLYSAHAVAYRRRQGIDDDGVRMAVIVQQQLPAEAAGVLFTRDPVSGDARRFVVNATFGLGEGVVAGHIPTDHFGLHPKTGKVLSSRLSYKEHMMALAPKEGLARIEVEARRRAEPSLSDGHLRELGKLAIHVKRRFRGHQDIEFAVVNGTVQLLQARPVTAVHEEPAFPITWDHADDEKHAWLLGSMERGHALPARRLEQDVFLAYAEGSRVCFEETGSPLARLHINRYVNGYRYMRQPDVPEETIERRLATFQEGVAFYTEQRRSWWDEALRPEVQRNLDELSRFRPRGATLPQLVAHLEHAVDAFAHILGDLHWRLAARVTTGGPLAWAEEFSELTGQPDAEYGVLVQAIENETTRMVRWLRRLARAVQGDRTLRSIFASAAYERLSAPGVRDRPTVRRFGASFRNFLCHFGGRTGRGFGSASQFSTPTWSMDPRQPLALIGAYAEQDLGVIDRLEANARRERERTVRRLRRSFAGDPERLQRFDSLVFQARDGVRTMENHNHMMEQSTGGALREAIYWVGRRLVRDRLFDDPDDVLHLSLEELRAFARGKGPANLRALVRDRQREFAEQGRMRPPPVIGSGSPASLPPMPKWMELPENAGRDGKVIRGVSGSRGRVSGRARVAPPSARPPEVAKGEILVAQNAGPNWTPVFPIISGLVLDQGAVFQHAALVAREYRIPAVIMTRDATAEIKDGQTITVDGDQGVVELA